MEKISTKKLALNGLMIALVFLATFFTRIPTPVPPGYVNVGDAVIMVAAILLGKRSGLIAGAVGSALADLVAGAYIFVPVTFIVKGLEGFLIGVIASHNKGISPGEIKKIIAVILGALVMVAGYFIAESYILGFFDTTFGVTAAIAEVVPNLMQGGVSAVIGYLLVTVLEKVNIERLINS